MINSLLEKLQAHLLQQSVRNVCKKLKVYCLSRFYIGACQVFSTQKFFDSEIPLTIKSKKSNTL